MEADQLKLPYIYVRPKPKEHGLGNQIEGHFEKGQRVLVIEDLISTGKSSLQVVDVVRAAGMQVEGMVSLFNYGFQQAVDAFATKEVKFLSLTNYEQLVKLAVEKGWISSEMESTLLKWHQDPAHWTGME